MAPGSEFEIRIAGVTALIDRAELIADRHRVF